MSRCERFIEEFNDDAVKRFDMSNFPAFKSQHLAMQDGNEVVCMYYTFHWQGCDQELMLDMELFNPEAGEEDYVHHTCEMLGLEEDKVIARLKKAKLIDA